VAAKSPKGNKVKAGQLLSKFLRSVAEEKTELENIGGEDALITKAESLARKMWDIALGKPSITVDKKTGARVEVKNFPDKTMMSLIFERVEGKAPLAQEGSGRQEISDRVDEQAKNRIEAAGESTD
jgi:hypothetical protein